MEAIRNALRCVARPLSRRVGRLPLGIWFAWLAFAYAAAAGRHTLFALIEDPIGNVSVYSVAMVNWAAIVAAVIALIMRRRISQLFGGIACANLLAYSISIVDWFGVAVVVLGFTGLLVNRRWFYEKLPNVE